MFDDDDFYDFYDFPDIGGVGSLYDLSDRSSPPRLAGMKSVSAAAAVALDRRRWPTPRPAGFVIWRSR